MRAWKWGKKDPKLAKRGSFQVRKKKRKPLLRISGLVLIQREKRRQKKEVENHRPKKPASRWRNNSGMASEKRTTFKNGEEIEPEPWGLNGSERYTIQEVWENYSTGDGVTIRPEKAGTVFERTATSPWVRQASQTTKKRRRSKRGGKPTQTPKSQRTPLLAQKKW